MKAITNCSKCTDGKNKTPLTLHGTCDLKPMGTQKGSCALKAAMHIVDDDVSNNEKNNTPKFSDRRGRK